MDFEAPLLTMQVTKVKHASLVLGLAMNHCLTDDLSAIEFLRC
jgi:omega-hydroxypalmitate O-feruloyl transferase